MHKILVIRLYFPLDAVRVSDYISPSSGATFKSCTSHIKVAPDDGLTESVRCTAYKRLLLMMD